MAAAEEPAFDKQKRQSFVYSKLVDLGARFLSKNGALVAIDYGDPAADLALAHRLGLADLSPLPRTGFKGQGAVEWLAEQSIVVGPDSNRGYRQFGGVMALRLAPTEVMVVDSVEGEGRLIAGLDAAWRWGEERPRRPIGYPMPRADSHCWFAVTGTHAAEMFAKLCGVDLRAHRFPDGMIAQTSIARMSGIILRRDFRDTHAFYLLADSASAEYLWDCLYDAMGEFDGGAIGLAALQQLEGL
jgi:sarcosine oxidase subunit gamma